MREIRRDGDSERDSGKRLSLPEARESLADVAFMRRRQFLFESTGNVAHALAAYRGALKHQVAVPEWVSRAVDDVSGKLLTGATNTKALGLHTPGRTENEERNVAIWLLVDILKRRDPKTLSAELREELLQPDGVFVVVGRRKNLSPESVREIYYSLSRYHADE